MAGKGKRKLSSFTLCVLCAIACAGCVSLYLLSVQGQAQQARADALAKYGGDQVEVCVALRDIAAGETIDSASFQTKLWIADLLPEGAVTNANDIVGKQAGSTVLAGEVISMKRVGSNADALDIPSGLTAVTVAAKDIQAVGGALKPGMAVDMYATNAQETFLLGAGVPVLATSASALGDAASAVTWVTLAVAPAEVSQVVSASQSMTIYFVLPGENAEAGAVASGTKANARDAAGAGAGAGAGGTESRDGGKADSDWYEQGAAVSGKDGR